MELEFFSTDELVSYCNENLPLHGVVSKVEGSKGSSDFYYLKLGKEWDDFAETLVATTEKLFKVFVFWSVCFC
jgi:hypothetical protein